MKRTIQSLTILALLLGACNGLTPKPQPTPTLADTLTPAPTDTPIPPTVTPTTAPTLTATPQIVDYGPDNFPTNIDPLTGNPVGDTAILERRPLSVKIQLFPRNDRPPYGLAAADIVYDYYHNNGMTRLNAIFYSQDAEQVGPIRSGRLLDSNIIKMYKVIFAFGGADKKVLYKLFSGDYSNRLLVEGPSNCPPLCRLDPNGADYLIVNTKGMGPHMAGEGVSNTRQDLNGMKFQKQAPANGIPATQIYIHHSISAYARWDYDPATGRYLRFQDTQEATNGQPEGYAPLTDRLTGQQIAAENVVVLLAAHKYTYKAGASEIIDITFSGTGKAYAFRDGQVYELQWNHPVGNAIFSLTFPDGTLYPYKQGVTWYQPVGQSTMISKPQDGVWRFDNKFP
jgi:hypothetical protein